MPLTPRPINSKQAFFFRNYAVNYKSIEHHNVVFEDGMLMSKKDATASSPVSIELHYRKCEKSDFQHIGRVTLCGDSITYALGVIIDFAKEAAYKPLTLLNALDSSNLIFEENPHFRTMLDFQEETQGAKDRLYEIREGILKLSREAYAESQKAVSHDQFGSGEYTAAKDKEEILLKVLELFEKK